MKQIYRYLVLVIGMYLIYEGYSTFTFTARSYDGSMGITKFGTIFIPATDFHLHSYGVSFFLVGVLIALIPFIRFKRRFK
jgi:hypothetical protein